MKHFLVGILILQTTLNWCIAQSSQEFRKKPPATSTGAQAPVVTPKNPPYFRVLQTSPTVTLPPEKDAWAIEVRTSGGFSGGGKGDLIITSRGNISSIDKGTEQNFRVSAERLDDLTKLLVAAKPSGWPATTNSFCKDCFVTVLTVHRRVSGDIQEQVTVTWDDSTSGALPIDLKQLYSAAVALSRRDRAANSRFATDSV